MKKKTIASIAIPLVIVCLIVAMRAGRSDDHVRNACAIAGLARPPANAKILRSGGWSIGFSDQFCFVFKATREEIDEWISSSPSLGANTPDVLCENHSLISFGSRDEIEKWREAHPDKMLLDRLNGPRLVREYREMERSYELPEMHYCVLPPGGFSWFKPNITDGRIFEIPRYYCSVFVDDANDVVWVAASES